MRMTFTLDGPIYLLSCMTPVHGVKPVGCCMAMANVTFDSAAS